MTESNKNNLSKTVKQLRKKMGISQEKLARFADVSNNTIINIEAGKQNNPTIDTLKKIAKEGPEAARIQTAATQVYIQSAFPKLDQMAKEIFSALNQGEELKTLLMGLKKLTRFTPDNLIKLRREIVESILPIGKYHLTRL